MGFFNVLKDVGKGILDTVKEKQERILYYKELYSDRDDQELFRIYKSASGEKRIGVGLLLKERGYGKQNED